MTQTEVVPLGDWDIDDAGRALALAFQDDPFHSYAIPDVAERARVSPAHFATLVRFGHMFGDVLTAHGAPDAVVVSQPPGADVTPERAVQSGFDRLPEIIGMDAVQRLGGVFDFLQPYAKRAVPDEHWYVMVVGVAPAQQGRGLGHALMGRVLERARERGLPCYLETANPRNIPFYGSLGFKVVDEFVEPVSNLRFWTFRHDA